MHLKAVLQRGQRWPGARAASLMKCFRRGLRVETELVDESAFCEIVQVELNDGREIGAFQSRVCDGVSELLQILVDFGDGPKQNVLAVAVDAETVVMENQLFLVFWLKLDFNENDAPRRLDLQLFIRDGRLEGGNNFCKVVEIQWLTISSQTNLQYKQIVLSRLPNFFFGRHVPPPNQEIAIIISCYSSPVGFDRVFEHNFSVLLLFKGDKTLYEHRLTVRVLVQNKIAVEFRSGYQVAASCGQVVKAVVAGVHGYCMQVVHIPGIWDIHLAPDILSVVGSEVIIVDLIRECSVDNWVLGPVHIQNHG